MISKKSERPVADSTAWMAQQLDELKASGSPAYDDVLDQLVKINKADIIARNAYLHGKTSADDYMQKLGHRLMDIQFDPNDPAKEFPYRRDNGKIVSLLATTLLRKFEAMQINERLNDVQRRMDNDVRRMSQTGLTPTDTIVKPTDTWKVDANAWANTDPDTIKPDQIIGDKDFGYLPELPDLPEPEPESGAAPAPASASKSVLDKWSPDWVHKAELVIRHNIQTYKGDELAGYVIKTLRPLHQEVFAELQKRAAVEGDKPDDSHLFTFMTSVRGHIKDASARLAPAVTIAPKPASVVPADAQAILDKAISGTRAQLNEVPAKKSWRERLGELGTATKNLAAGVGRWLGQATEALNSKPVRQLAAGLLLGTVATTPQHAETNKNHEPDAAGKMSHVVPANAVQRVAVDVLTVPAAPAVQAAHAAPAATASVTEFVAPAAVMASPKVASPAPARRTEARADFLAQAAVETREVPDELSVTFNGQKLKADVFTVKAACDQIGNASSICDNFVKPAPKQG